eukprot:COSAG01_NODE_549_length_15608_cov_206.443355_8_plen_77_part_00
MQPLKRILVRLLGFGQLVLVAGLGGALGLQELGLPEVLVRARVNGERCCKLLGGLVGEILFGWTLALAAWVHINGE